MSSPPPVQAAEVAVTPAAAPTRSVNARVAAASPAKKPRPPAQKEPAKAAAQRVTTAAAKKAAIAPIQRAALEPAQASAKNAKSKVAGTAPQRTAKIKMVRDSFTFPETEHKRLVEMKKRLIALGTEVKKGELVRAGLELLAALDNQKLLKAVAGVEKLKTGRPKK